MPVTVAFRVAPPGRATPRQQIIQHPPDQLEVGFFCPILGHAPIVHVVPDPDKGQSVFFPSQFVNPPSFLHEVSRSDQGTRLVEPSGPRWADDRPGGGRGTPETTSGHVVTDRHRNVLDYVTVT